MATTATATKTKIGLSDSAKEAAQRILDRAARRVLEERQRDVEDDLRAQPKVAA